MGSTSLDRQNLWNSLKRAVDRQQREFFKTVSCPTIAVSFPATEKYSAVKGGIYDSCSCCVGQVVFWIIHFCRSSDLFA